MEGEVILCEEQWELLVELVEGVGSSVAIIGYLGIGLLVYVAIVCSIRG